MSDPSREVQTMTDTSAKRGRIRVVFSPSTPLLKILVVVLLTFSLVALAALNWVRIRVQSQTEDLRAQTVSVAGENQKLQERLADMDSDDAVRAIAKEELGLAEPGTVMIQPN